MTNTEFIVRHKNPEHHGLFNAGGIGLSAVDGMLILGFLTVFVGLIFLLSK